MNACAAVIAGALAITAASACSGRDLPEDGSTRPPGTTGTTSVVASTSNGSAPMPSTGVSTTSSLGSDPTSVTVPPTERVERTTTVPSSDTPTSTTVSMDELGIVVVPVDPELAARGLESAVGCDEADPRIAFADLTWRPSDRAEWQRVQVTADPMGFEGASTMTSPELDRDSGVLRWLDLAGQSVHSWRVITRLSDDQRWYASPVATFEGPVCAIDYRSG